MTTAPAKADMHTSTEGFRIRGVHLLCLGALVAVCLIPLALMGLGVDFSSMGPALGTGKITIDEASRTLRGSFTHTLLEWTVVCAALFVGLLAGYIGTYRRGKASARALRRALRISENNQLALDEHAIVSIADIRGNITFVNDKFCAISGYSREELIGRHHRLVESNVHTGEFYRDMWLTISKGEVWSGEIKNRSKAGNAYWVAATIVPFRDSNGKIDQYVTLRTDITVAKEAEQVAKAHADQIHKANRELEAFAREAESMNADLQEANKELARAMAEIREAASTDKLTGLANRRVFLNRLDSAIVSSSGEEGDTNRFAVLFFDFDRFKVVNDSLGHDIGDALLRDIADIFGKYIRDGDTVARFGGDEFVVLLTNLSEWSDAKWIAEELLSAFALPHYLSNHQIVTTASVGLVTNEHRYKCSGDMIRDADAAMYEAKDNGKEQVVAFDSEMHAKAIDRLSLESDLRYAISMKQLRLVYQPIINLETGDLSGFEALIRWDHPSRGLVSPVDFIPIADKSQLATRCLDQRGEGVRFAKQREDLPVPYRGKRILKGLIFREGSTPRLGVGRRRRVRQIRHGCRVVQPLRAGQANVNEGIKPDIRRRSIDVVSQVFAHRDPGHHGVYLACFKRGPQLVRGQDLPFTGKPRTLAKLVAHRHFKPLKCRRIDCVTARVVDLHRSDGHGVSQDGKCRERNGCRQIRDVFHHNLLVRRGA